MVLHFSAECSLNAGPGLGPQKCVGSTVCSQAAYWWEGKDRTGNGERLSILDVLTISVRDKGRRILVLLGSHASNFQSIIRDKHLDNDHIQHMAPGQHHFGIAGGCSWSPRAWPQMAAGHPWVRYKPPSSAPTSSSARWG